MAAQLGATPLLEAIQRLADQAHVDLTQPLPAPAYDRVTTVAGISLTEREGEVLAHLVAGETYREIAHALYISEKTVSLHVSRLLAKDGHPWPDRTGRRSPAPTAPTLGKPGSSEANQERLTVTRRRPPGDPPPREVLRWRAPDRGRAHGHRHFRAPRGSTPNLHTAPLRAHRPGVENRRHELLLAQHPRARWAAPVRRPRSRWAGWRRRRAARAARATWHRARPTTCWSTSSRRARPRSAGPWCRRWTSASPTCPPEPSAAAPGLPGS